MWVDAHCHPTDTPKSLVDVAELGVKMICMSTRFDDPSLVSEAAMTYPDQVIPAFGLHPWFAHMVCLEDDVPSKRDHYNAVLIPAPSDSELDLLPSPVPLATHLATLRILLHQHPDALVGEIGLDRAFKVRIGSVLSKMKTGLDHQLAVLRAQLELAAENGRAVSLHGVQAHMPLFEAVKNAPKGIRAVDLHAYSGSADLYVNHWLTLDVPVYVSMAVVINSRSEKTQAVLARIPASRILSESDYHSAGTYQLALIQQSMEVLTSLHPDIDVESNLERFLKGNK